jgi:ABC-type transporter Mla subunit MlaD
MIRFSFILFVLIGLNSCSDSNEKQNTLTLYSITGEGIDSSTKVLYLGVDIGVVKEATLTDNLEVKIIILLRDEIKIPDDAIAKLIQKEILDSYIEFGTGISKSVYNTDSKITLYNVPSLINKIKGEREESSFDNEIMND